MKRMPSTGGPILDYRASWALIWSRFLGSQPAGDLVINPAVGCHYSTPGPRYLPSRRASQPLGRYQIILLGDRGIQVWVVCPGPLRGGVRSEIEPAIRQSQVRCPNNSTTVSARRGLSLAIRHNTVLEQLSFNQLYSPIKVDRKQKGNDKTKIT